MPILIPYQINAKEYSIFVALDASGFDRLKQYDPAEFSLNKVIRMFSKLKLSSISVGYANEQDIQVVAKMLLEDGNPQRALNYLSRGWEYHPEKGDHDGPPMSIKPDGSKVQ